MRTSVHSKSNSNALTTRPSGCTDYISVYLLIMILPLRKANGLGTRRSQELVHRWHFVLVHLGKGIGKPGSFLVTKLFLSSRFTSWRFPDSVCPAHNSKTPYFIKIPPIVLPNSKMNSSLSMHQDSRVVKALVLSYNGPMPAWVRTPLLVKTSFQLTWKILYSTTFTMVHSHVEDGWNCTPSL